MTGYIAKCKECGYEVKVHDGPVMIEVEYYYFTETATFICPECKRTLIKKVLLTKKDIKDSIKSYFSSSFKPENITPGVILKNFLKALEETSSYHYCSKCKTNMLKFTKEHIENKICPVCGKPIELDGYLDAD